MSWLLFQGSPAIPGNRSAARRSCRKIVLNGDRSPQGLSGAFVGRRIQLSGLFAQFLKRKRLAKISRGS